MDSKPIGDVRMEFRGEVFVSRALRNPLVRGCPICLREDAEVLPDASAAAPALRGDWQLCEVNLCVRHRHPLVNLWREQSPTKRYDISPRLVDIRAMISDGHFDQHRVKPSPYDLWLDTRLAEGRDETWLAGHSLYAGTTFCRLLGAELVRHADPLNAGDLRAAQAAGFAVAHRGEEVVRAAGEVVLGHELPRRRLHSISTAEHETGLWAPTIEAVLIEAGAVSPTDTRPANRKTFDAERFSPLLAEMAHWVGATKLRTAMGATQNELAALAADGVLLPASAVPSVKYPWRLEDGLALVAEIKARVQEGAASSADWESVQMASKRSGLRVGAIIGAIRKGVLRLGGLSGD